MAWAEYTAAFFTFFVLHAVPVRPPVKTALTARLGRSGFTAVYSLASLLALAWLIGAAYRAPYVPLWEWEPWQNWVPLLAMAPVCLILGFGLGRPNPFSFGGRNTDRFDPDHPGVVRWIRHPVLAALALWGAAHLVPNGDLAHALLFGALAGFALLGQRMIDRRKRRQMGSAWEDLRARVAAGQLLPRPTTALGPALRLGLSTVAYLSLLWLHPHLFGVAPLP